MHMTCTHYVVSTIQPEHTVQITCNVAFACAHGFARGLIIAEGGGVAPVLLVSVHP